MFESVIECPRSTSTRRRGRDGQSASLRDTECQSKNRALLCGEMESAAPTEDRPVAPISRFTRIYGLMENQAAPGKAVARSRSAQPGGEFTRRERPPGNTSVGSAMDYTGTGRWPSQ